VLYLFMPTPELVDLVQEQERLSALVQRATPDVVHKPSEDVTNGGRLLAQDFEIEPDEENVRSSGASTQKILDDVVDPSRLSHLARPTNDLDEALVSTESTRELDHTGTPISRGFRANDRRASPPRVEILQYLY